MFESPSRRTFLRQCAAAAVSTGGLLAAPQWGTAIEPVSRNGKPKFKFSVAAYSYRNLLRGDDPELTLADFIDDCAKMDLEGTELTSYFFPKDLTPQYIRGLKQQCFQLGLDVSGTAVGNDFGHADEKARQEQIAHVKQWVDHAEILGAPVIRIFAGHQKKGVDAAKSHALMVAGIEECCDYAGQHGVHLALENHGGPTSTAKGLLAFVNDVQSPWFGVNLDTGNFHSEHIYEELAQVAKYALNVQVKVTVSGPDRKKQPSDLKRLAQILKDADYRGYIVLEYEENGNPRTECPKYMDELREAFA